MSTDFLKAELTALVVLSVVIEPVQTAEHVNRAQELWRGWTFLSAFQYVSGKKFLSALQLAESVELRATWALPHVIAKEFAGTNNWSGSGSATAAGMQRYEELANAILAAAAIAPMSPA